MQYTVNHAGVEKRARGETYDAFRLGLANNDEGVQPDYDLVLQSKRQKGYDYKYGILPKGENETSIQAYFDNQEPLRTGTFKDNIQQIKTHFTPATQALVLLAAGAGGIAAGAPNLIGLAAGNNLAQVNQAASGLNLFAPPGGAVPPPGAGLGTNTAPLGQGSINPPAPVLPPGPVGAPRGRGGPPIPITPPAGPAPTPQPRPKGGTGTTPKGGKAGAKKNNFNIHHMDHDDMILFCVFQFYMVVVVE